MYDRHGLEFLVRMITNYQPIIKLAGLFGSKQLYVFDPKALYHIVVKDQYIYEETPTFLLMCRTVFGEGLLASTGEHHRRQRKILNPVFSVDHMRRLTPIFYEVTHRLRKALSTQLQQGPKEIEMLQWLSRTALEIIGQGGLGHTFDSLEQPEPNPMADAIKSIPLLISPFLVFRPLLPFFLGFSTAEVRKRLADWIPIPRLQRLRKMSTLLEDTAKDVLASRRAGIANGSDDSSRKGSDLMTILLRENMAAGGKDQMSETELLGHIGTMTFAALETTSSALARALHVLAARPNVQNKLREELRKARQDGDIGFDELMSLPYLDAVCREALRLYPPFPHLTRRSVRDAVLPLSQPITGVDGTTMSEIFVPKDTNIMIGILGSNLNPAVWGDDVLEFKPERWLAPLPEAITEAHIPGVYSNLMTFLGGGRACIGFKFSQLEMKVVLSVLLDTFQFNLSSQDIYWNLGAIQYPSAGPLSAKPELILEVSLASPG